MTPEEHRVRVGERLQQIRGPRDQRTFAEAVDSVQQTISKYERGEIPRSWLFLARLRAEEGVDLNHLLSGRLMQAESGGATRAESNGGQRNGKDAESEDRAPHRHLRLAEN
ncbi:hypothetical protein BH18GEM1_BH18GEM1_22140 [soil metagenome]